MSFLSVAQSNEDRLAPEPESTGSTANRGLTARRKRPKIPDDQRKRVKVACEYCRKNKLRCNGSTPCERCADMGRHCQYTLISRKESRQCIKTQPAGGGSPDEQLQLLQQIFEKTHPDVPTDAESLRNFYTRMQSNPSEARGGSAPLHDQSTLVMNNGGEQSSNDSLFNANMPNRAASMTVVNQGKTHFEGGSSLWCFFRSVRLAFTDEATPNDDNGEAECHETTIHQISSGFGTDWVTGVLNALPPREVVNFLANSYFQLAQANYFCLHPELFSRKLSAFYDRTHEFESRDSLNSRKSIEFISVLFMVLAMGSQFAEIGERESGETVDDSISVDEELLIEDLFSSYNLSRIKVPVPAQNPGWRFYEVSRKLLPDIICSSSMTSIQVCLLQGIYLPSTTSRDAACNLLGLALRMAINMGLHRSFLTSSLHTHVRELRNRLWWSIYVADRLYSIDMGRPLGINDSEIDAPFPTEMPGWNDGQGRPVPIDGLVSLAKLCRVLGQIVDTVYCKAASENRSTIRPSEFQKLKQDLRHWKQNLPSHINIESFTTRSEAHLALTYHQTIILLTRSCLNYATEIETSHGSIRVEAAKFLQQQAQECINAAIASIQVISKLKARSILCVYSFHDSLYCSSALYVLILASRKLASSVVVPHKVFQQGICALLELAQGSEVAALSLKGIIQALSSAPAKTDHAGNKDAISTGSDYNNSQEKGRLAWKAWKMMATNSKQPIGCSSIIPEMAGEANIPDTSRTEVGCSPTSDQLSQLGIPKYTFNGQQGYNENFDAGSLLSFPVGGTRYTDTPVTRTDDNIEMLLGISDMAPFWFQEHPAFETAGREYSL